jgi:hypothetical protein
MLFHEEDVSSCSRIRLMVSKMTSTSTAARPGKGRSGNSRLGFPFGTSLASIGGSTYEIATATWSNEQIACDVGAQLGSLPEG